MIILGQSHNQKSQGARTPDGLSEWMIAGDVNEAIQDELRDRCNNGRSVMRLGGYLHERISILRDIGKASHYDCAVECHCNAFSLPSKSGYSVLAWHKSKASIHLAACVLEALEKIRPEARNEGLCRVSTNKRWVGTSREYGEALRLALLEDTPGPAVIVEACYLTNPKEAAWISNLPNRKTLGWAIGRGIDNWLKESKEKES